MSGSVRSSIGTELLASSRIPQHFYDKSMKGDAARVATGRKLLKWASNNMLRGGKSFREVEKLAEL